MFSNSPPPASLTLRNLKSFFSLVIIVFVAVACAPKDRFPIHRSQLPIRDSVFSGRVELSPTRNGFRITLVNDAGNRLDQIIFNYPIYHFDTADITRDGKTEVLLGVIKSTTFDKGEKKRLFIIRIDGDQLRPLWLGSKVCQELIDFKTLSNGHIQTLEKTHNGNYAIGNYEWQSFGLALVTYTHNEKSYDDATKLFGI